MNKVMESKAVSCFGVTLLVCAVVIASLTGYYRTPNKIPRIVYMKDNISIETKLLRDVQNDALDFLGISTERSDLAVWVKWLATQESDIEYYKKVITKKYPTRRFVWIEQALPFQSDYKTFIAELEYNSVQFRLGNRAAFLVRSDPQTNITYRQLLFYRDGDMYSDRFEITKPNLGDHLLIILKIESKDGQPITSDVKQYQLSVSKSH